MNRVRVFLVNFSFRGNVDEEEKTFSSDETIFVFYSPSDNRARLTDTARRRVKNTIRYDCCERKSWMCVQENSFELFRSALSLEEFSLGFHPFFYQSIEVESGTFSTHEYFTQKTFLSAAFREILPFFLSLWQFFYYQTRTRVVEKLPKRWKILFFFFFGVMFVEAANKLESRVMYDNKHRIRFFKHVDLRVTHGE